MKRTSEAPVVVDRHIGFWNGHCQRKNLFPGKASVFSDSEKMKQVYHELHIITLETAFVVRSDF